MFYTKIDNNKHVHGCMKLIIFDNEKCHNKAHIWKLSFIFLVHHEPLCYNNGPG